MLQDERKNAKKLGVTTPTSQVLQAVRVKAAIDTRRRARAGATPAGRRRGSGGQAVQADREATEGRRPRRRRRHLPQLQLRGSEGIPRLATKHERDRKLPRQAAPARRRGTCCATGTPARTRLPAKAAQRCGVSETRVPDASARSLSPNPPPAHHRPDCQQPRTPARWSHRWQARGSASRLPWAGWTSAVSSDRCQGRNSWPPDLM